MWHTKYIKQVSDNGMDFLLKVNVQSKIELFKAGKLDKRGAQELIRDAKEIKYAFRNRAAIEAIANA